MLNRYNKQINFISLLLIAFFIPISKKTVTFLILIYGLNWLLLQNYKEKFTYLKKNILKVLFLTSIYLIYLLSLSYTSNMDSGWFDLEVKLTLFLIPVILFSYPLLSKSETLKLLISFISGCFVATAICLINATYRYFETGNVNVFLYSNFSFLFHPTYFALYLNFAIVILLGFIIDNRYSSKYLKIIYPLSILFLSIGILLANSKSVFLTYVFTFFIAGIYWGFKKGIVKISVMLSLGIIIIIAVIFIKIPFLSGRVKASVGIVGNIIHKEKVNDYESTSQRLQAWESSIAIIKGNFLTGVGAGDVKDVLIEEYTKQHYEYLVEKKLNSHNQFLQTFIATGIVGFLILISLFIFPLINSFKRKNFVYFSFLMIILLNLLTESMFETQAGVVFFAFFNSYLFAHSPSD